MELEALKLPVCNSAAALYEQHFFCYARIAYSTVVRIQRDAQTRIHKFPDRIGFPVRRMGLQIAGRAHLNAYPFIRADFHSLRMPLKGNPMTDSGGSAFYCLQYIFHPSALSGVDCKRKSELFCLRKQISEILHRKCGFIPGQIHRADSPA